MLKPQDNLVLLWHLAHPKDGPRTFAALAEALGLSVGEVHNATGRLLASRLLLRSPSGPELHASVKSAGEYLEHGLPYVFPAEPGPQTRGIPTGTGCPVLNINLAASDLDWVWPHPEGKVRGPALAPIYRSAPDAALKDERLYALLALVDLLRIGRARERQQAGAVLRVFLNDPDEPLS